MGPASANVEPDSPGTSGGKALLLRIATMNICITNSWPPSGPLYLTGSGALQPETLRLYAGRLRAAMVKSVREAKAHSTWDSPNTPYEDALLTFLDQSLDPERSQAFWPHFFSSRSRHIPRAGAMGPEHGRSR